MLRIRCFRPVVADALVEVPAAPAPGGDAKRAALGAGAGAPSAAAAPVTVTMPVATGELVWLGEVGVEAARMTRHSGFVRGLMDDDDDPTGAGATISVEVEPATLELVERFLTVFESAPFGAIERPMIKELVDYVGPAAAAWVKALYDGVAGGDESPFKLAKAANMLEITPLVELTMAGLASFVRELNRDDVFRGLNIRPPTEEEDAESNKEFMADFFNGASVADLAVKEAVAAAAAAAVVD